MKNKKVLLWYILIVLLAIPAISAQTYQQKTPIDLKIPFEVNGTIASAIASCNISLQYPNSTSITKNASMTNLNNGEFNYTITEIESALLGEYIWTAFCCDGSRCAAGYGDFKITVSGDEDISSGEGLSLIGSLLVMGLVCAFLFIISMRINYPFGKFALMVFAFLILVMIIFYSMVIVQQTLGGFANIVSGYTTFFFVLKLFIYISFLALCIFSILVVIRYYKFKRGLID